MNWKEANFYCATNLYNYSCTSGEQLCVVLEAAIPGIIVQSCQQFSASNWITRAGAIRTILILLILLCGSGWDTLLGSSAVRKLGEKSYSAKKCGMRFWVTYYSIDRYEAQEEVDRVEGDRRSFSPWTLRNGQTEPHKLAAGQVFNTAQMCYYVYVYFTIAYRAA